jgi:hypothetical protein
MRTWVTILVLIAFPCFPLASPRAVAAGIDCSRAVSTVEKAICQHEDMLEADRDIAHAYGELMHAYAGEELRGSGRVNTPGSWSGTIARKAAGSLEWHFDAFRPRVLSKSRPDVVPLNTRLEHRAAQGDTPRRHPRRHPPPRLQTGRMESLDNQIGVIEHWACGSHSFADFAAMLFPAAAP